MTNIFELLTTSIFLVIYAMVIFFLPAWLFVKKLKISRLEKITLSLVLGFGTSSALIYLLREFGFWYWVIEVPLLILSLVQLGQLRMQSLKKIKVTKFHLLLAGSLLILGLIHGSVLIQSAINTDKGIEYVELSFHDSMQHLSFITRLQQSGQVNHPGFAGAQLRNYHYMIDSTLAAMTRFEWVSLNHAYYRFYPIFISAIFGLSLFVTIRRMIGNRNMAIFGIIYVLFAANASYYFSFFRPADYSWGSNSFIINPIIDILQNPASIFVLAQLLMVLLLLDVFLHSTSRKINYTQLLMIGLISGTMIGFKAWGGIIIMLGLGAAAAWQTIKDRRFELWLSLIVGGVISASLFLPGYDAESSASPVWAPGWTLEKLVHDADRWNFVPDIYARDTFIAQNDFLGLIKIYSKWVFLYIFGNYWTRIIGLIVIFGLVFKLKKLDPRDVAIIVMTSASLIIPLLFNQGRMAYDIEQFSPYAILLASIATVVVLGQVINHFQLSSKYPVLVWVGLIIFLVISMPSNYTSLKARLLPSKKLITKSELELFTQVNQLTPADAIILLYPSQRNIATLEFSAMTTRDTFYSGRTLSVITGEPFEQRRQELAAVFERSEFDRDQYFKANQITHVFVYQDENLGQLAIDDLEMLFQNSAGSLYGYRPSEI